uniref:Ig-like domain-containing protein n=1 Tax=Panthera leo TaxID=9689 RepID=A0A8C9D1J3_PANLE
MPLPRSSLTQTPDILISGTLEFGHPSNLTCSVPWACAWGTPPIFSWTSAALTALGPKTHLSSVLTLTPRLQDHGTDLTCQVTLPGTGVTTMRTIHLNVSCENRARATWIPDGVLRAVGWGVRPGTLGVGSWHVGWEGVRRISTLFPFMQLPWGLRANVHQPSPLTPICHVFLSQILRGT